MESLRDRYRALIVKVFQDYIDFLGEEEGIQLERVVDSDHDRYLIVETGWQNGYRIYGTFLHLDIIGEKVWIQHDGTEDGIAYELEAAGIPKEHIVLAFKPASLREFTGYAVS